MHLTHCILDTLDDDATKTEAKSSARWCPAMRLLPVSLRCSHHVDIDPMRELDIVVAIDHHSMLGMHILDEHLDGHMVSDLFHLSGRGAPARTCLCHVAATMTVDSVTVAASVDNER